MANKWLYDLDKQIQQLITSQEFNKTSSSKEQSDSLAYSNSAVKLAIEIAAKQGETQNISNVTSENQDTALLTNNLGDLDKKLQVSTLFL